MIGVLVVTHGSIGEALVTSASQILGSMPPQVATLSVWRQDDPDDLVPRARELLDGLDVIGDYLTEVNVTSPTCFREIQDQTGFDVAGLFVSALEKKIG